MQSNFLKKKKVSKNRPARFPKTDLQGFQKPTYKVSKNLVGLGSRFLVFGQQTLDFIQFHQGLYRGKRVDI